MDFSELISYLKHNNINYCVNGKTREIVSFRIGGDAKLIIFPKSINQLAEIIAFVKNDKHIVLGNGTNCYFTDGLYQGIVIVSSGISNVVCIDNYIIADAGAGCSAICQCALANSLSGLEFAYGIPGTVGGCVAMNASAFENSFSQIVYECTVYDYETEKITVFSSSECCFAKKKSIFSTKKLCLLSVKLKLNRGDKNAIFEKMQANLNKRKNTQPLDKPSAGSTFVRPEKGYASQMIDGCGLKGYTVGGAQVSNKHAGFIVNLGNATSNDVKKLIEIVKNRVYDAYGVILEEEIIYIE